MAVQRFSIEPRGPFMRACIVVALVVVAVGCEKHEAPQLAPVATIVDAGLPDAGPQPASLKGPPAACALTATFIIERSGGHGGLPYQVVMSPPDKVTIVDTTQVKSPDGRSEWVEVHCAGTLLPCGPGDAINVGDVSRILTTGVAGQQLGGVFIPDGPKSEIPDVAIHEFGGVHRVRDLSVVRKQDADGGVWYGEVRLGGLPCPSRPLPGLDCQPIPPELAAISQMLKAIKDDLQARHLCTVGTEPVHLGVQPNPSPTQRH